MESVRFPEIFIRTTCGTPALRILRTAVSGGLRLVPGDKALTNLSRDYESMLEDGLLFDDAEPFELLMNQCRALEARANKPA